MKYKHIGIVCLLCMMWLSGCRTAGPVVSTDPGTSHATAPTVVAEPWPDGKSPTKPTGTGAAASTTVVTTVTPDEFASPTNYTMPPPGTITGDQMTATEEAFRAFICSLDVDSVTAFGFDYLSSSPRNTAFTNYTTTDRALIAEWIAFFRQLELVGQPYAPPDGSPFHQFYVVIDDREVLIAFGNLPQFHHPAVGTMLVPRSPEQMSAKINDLFAREYVVTTRDMQVLYCAETYLK